MFCFSPLVPTDPLEEVIFLCLTGGPNLHNVVQYFFDVWVVEYRFHLAGQLTRSQNLGIAQGAGGRSINFTATVDMGGHTAG